MASCSEKNSEKRLTSIATKFLIQGNYLMKYSGVCTENLENTQDLPKQSWLTGKKFFPKMPQLITDWVMSCEQCIRESGIDRSLSRPPLRNPKEHITAPEDALQIDLMLALPPSGGCQIIVTAMDVFYRFLFAYPTSNQETKTIAKVIINIMTKHAYLPRTLVSDKVSAFVSHVFKIVPSVLGITLKHATKKHALIIGLLERSHASIKPALKIETGERHYWGL